MSLDATMVTDREMVLQLLATVDQQQGLVEELRARVADLHEYGLVLTRRLEEALHIEVSPSCMYI
jgi:hypothetical protein